MNPINVADDTIDDTLTTFGDLGDVRSLLGCGPPDYATGRVTLQGGREETTSADGEGAGYGNYDGDSTNSWNEKERLLARSAQPLMRLCERAACMELDAAEGP